jgi:excisionase family DNA binding protein
MALIGTEAAAKKLGVTGVRIRAMIRSGIIPAKKIGRDWLLEESVLELSRVRNRRPGRPQKRR